MSRSASISRCAWQRRPLASCVAAVFATIAPAVTFGAAVTNCNGVGPGSLRAAIGVATSGDTIDLTSLTCSVVTLEDSQIVIPQHDLTIEGPPSSLTITHDGNYDRILNHQGNGVLRLENLNLTGGHPYSATHGVYGGCLYSKGNVYLSNATVSNCYADANGKPAQGGGVFTIGRLTVALSTLSGNLAGSPLSTEGMCGGAKVGGLFTAASSSIVGNTAKGVTSIAGGVCASSVSVYGSTISGNSAQGVGGLFAYGTNTDSAVIVNSTISGNSSNTVIGGVLSDVATIVHNSTIAFNSATNGKENGLYYAPGLHIATGLSNVSVDLESSILSNNTYVNYGTTIENDISLINNGGLTVTIAGARNLIQASVIQFAPGVVTATACPLLGPLRANGGPTQTHALLSSSPAIDAGEVTQFLFDDQRGAPYNRTNGVATDIGAYEVQQEEIIFNTSFEGC